MEQRWREGREREGEREQEEGEGEGEEEKGTTKILSHIESDFNRQIVR